MTRAGASLVRLGLTETWAEETLTQLGWWVGDHPAEGAEQIMWALARSPDPGLALRSAERLVAALSDRQAFDAALRAEVGLRGRLFALLGSSTVLADHLALHPDRWHRLRDDAGAAAEPAAALLAAVGAEPDAPPAGAPGGAAAALTGSAAIQALRTAYRDELVVLASADLAAVSEPELPVLDVEDVAARLSDLAGSALRAALAVAVAEAAEDQGREPGRLAIIAMGKCGGHELNYVSDVDVVFVAEPADAATARLAGRVMRILGESCFEVDANLRPEGRQGALVRTLDGHVSYYKRWAKTWEFQALLKARPVAGDRELGEEYLAAVAPLVWQAASRENFVEDVQAMRRRVEQHVPPAEADRQLKLGPGGLRDVEFSVQLLQLVHGRADDSLRSGTTLEALHALARGGYVGREDAAALDDSYRLLRTLEHRIQLYRLRRTHLMPTADTDLRRLGRGLGHRRDAVAEIVNRWQQQARDVRRIHERLFYRPLLAAVARLSTTEARLTPEAARERLAALGFRDPAGAMRHLEALTSGVSRRAAIQRTLLPVMLGWFADEADPDGGLLAFRKVSDDLGSTHWYLRLLRDEGSAAERLAHTLARSRFAADLLMGAPEAVAMLGDSGGLTPRPREDLVRRMTAAAGRKDDPERAVVAARGVRRQELFRISVADLTGQLDLDEVGRALTDLTAALIEVSLEVAIRSVAARHGGTLGTSLLVVGMGRLGGGESGYGSDADVLFVHEPSGSVPEDVAQDQALEVVQELRRLLGAQGPDPQLGLDADLRPEGKSGPLVRSLESYRSYYQRWSLTWESQALLRATPIAGEPALGRRFLELIDPLRWPAEGLTPRQVREIRTLKARMEAERLPRGADPKTHFKLGRGGLSDVEWTVQLLQMCHAHRVPGLRTTATLPALQAALDAGLVDPSHAEALRSSWTLASRMRNAAILFRGRPVDSVPSDLRVADGVSRIMGGEPGSGGELAESYRRVARRARSVVEVDFYDSP